MGELFNIILIGFMNTLVIVAINILVSENHFGFIKSFFERIVYYPLQRWQDTKKNKYQYWYNVNTTLYKPFLGCIICMNSFWGVTLLFLYMYLGYVDSSHYFLNYILSILSSVTFSYVANKYLFDN